MGVQAKILLPIVSISLLSGVFIFLYFTNMFEKNEKKALVTQAKTLVMEAESAREYAAEQINHNVFREGITNVDDALRTVPIFAAIRVAKAKAKELGLEVKVPKNSPRNPDNQPDAFEKEVLAKLESGTVEEHYQIDEQTNKLRYFRPVKLTQECMKCHGDPAQSASLWGNDKGLDLTGTKMENWKVGEVHGAIEVLLPLAPMQASLKENSFIIAGISLVSTLLLIAVGIFIARMVRKPLDVLKAANTDVASGNIDVQVQVQDYTEAYELAEGFNAMVRSIKTSQEHLEEEKASVEQMAASVQESAVALQREKESVERYALLYKKPKSKSNTFHKALPSCLMV